MPPERITLPRQVREYFAEIGKRGGQAGRRELTRQQANLRVAIRETKRLARKEGKPRCSGSPKQNGISQFPLHHFLSQQTIEIYRKPLTIYRIEALLLRMCGLPV